MNNKGLEQKKNVPREFGLGLGLKLGLKANLTQAKEENMLNVLFSKKNKRNNRLNFSLGEIFENASNEVLNKRKQKLNYINVKSAFGEVVIINDKYVIKKVKRDKYKEEIIRDEIHNIEEMNNLRGDVEEYIIKQYYELTAQNLYVVSKYLNYDGYESLKNYFLKNKLNANSRNYQIMKDKYFDIFNKIIEGIELLYLNGIVHDDLHFNNIFIKIEGEEIFIKFIDYGICTFRDSENFGREFFRCKVMLFFRMMKEITKIKLLEYLNIIIKSEELYNYFSLIESFIPESSRLTKGTLTLAYNKRSRSSTLTSLNNRSSLVTINGRSLTPTNNGRSLTPTNNGRSLTQANNGRSLTPTNNGRSLTPTNNGRSLTPTNNGRSLTPIIFGNRLREGLIKPKAIIEKNSKKALELLNNVSNFDSELNWNLNLNYTKNYNGYIIYVIKSLISVFATPRHMRTGTTIYNSLYMNKERILEILLNPQLALEELERIPISNRTKKTIKIYEKLIKIREFINECNEKLIFRTTESGTPNSVYRWIIDNN